MPYECEPFVNVHCAITGGKVAEEPQSANRGGPITAQELAARDSLKSRRYDFALRQSLANGLDPRRRDLGAAE